MNHQLSTRALALRYGERLVVDDLNLTIPVGKITVLVGRNGSGKSTILKALGRLLPPAAGGVYIDGKALHTMPSREVARSIAVLPQGPVAPEGLTVEGLVRYGRFPHQNWLGIASKEDERAVEAALRDTAVWELRERGLAELSGGQRQRAWIAMTLAQETPVLLLDEPTTYLDVAYQLDVLELVAKLNREKGRTVVMVLHDLNQAARYAHHLIAVAEGRVVAEGDPISLLHPPLIRQVFGIEAHVLPDPDTAAPVVVPRIATPLRC